ncbi:Hypothetical predicted protein [Olea europaea subsp. europaea]|uniref:Uncharacterized protein n=1 Tax=Olea europaea subsp. europaea TaxID=158383 RepID=A0A8S0SSN8_OLEEU|nr:Hypothetical predicted protein [Olea europaea subsp. europaea]
MSGLIPSKVMMIMEKLCGSSSVLTTEFIPRVKMCDRCFNQIPVKTCTLLLTFAIGVLCATIVHCGSDTIPQPPIRSRSTSKNETMPFKRNNIETTLTIPPSRNITKRMGSTHEQTAPLDLVVLADEDASVLMSRSASNRTAGNNLSSGGGGGGAAIEFNGAMSQNLTTTGNEIRNHGNQTSSDPLDTSDSYFSPYRMSPRYDASSHLPAEEMDEPMAESEDSDLASSLDSDVSYTIDGASSNLIE